MALVTFASPDYLARMGAPGHPSALSTHECVIDGNMSDGDVWRFDVDGSTVAVKVSGRLRSNSPAASVNFGKAGVAIARAPAYAASEALKSGSVVELFPENRSTPYVVAALYPASRRLTARVRALIDHLREDRDLCAL